MSLQAYQRTAARGENPRETEYRLLGQVTRGLIAAEEAGRGDFKALVLALDKNKRVWNTFALDCADSTNGLPDALRAQIISLSIFVRKFSSQAIRDKLSIKPLIDINRAIMQGLEARAANAAQANTPPAAANAGGAAPLSAPRSAPTPGPGGAAMLGALAR